MLLFNTSQEDNYSSSPSNFTKVNELDWIIPASMNAFLMGLTIYILICLIYHGVRTRKWSSQTLGDPNVLNSGLVYSSTVACAIMCLVRLIFSQIYINIGYKPGEDTACNVISDISQIFYALVLFSVVMFLWFRQRAFFMNRMLSVNYNRTIKLLSASSVAIVLGGGVLALILTLTPNDHRSTFKGCIYAPSNVARLGSWVSIVVAVVLGHVLLLFLLVYAMVKSGKPTVRNKARCGKNLKENLSTSFKAAETKRKNFTSELRMILLKTVAFAVLCVLCDVLIQVTKHYVIKGEQVRLVSLLLDVNAFLNLLFLILSFSPSRSALVCSNKTHPLR